VYAAIEPAEVSPPAPGVSVDVFVPVYDEAYELVETSLRAALAMRYPRQGAGAGGGLAVRPGAVARSKHCAAGICRGSPVDRVLQHSGAG
jgi:cellulose synthase/poly-beta-1,6-N-acetylglucosamine synthase-like glycosyltransferase